MIDGKESVDNFFDYLYSYMKEIIPDDDKNDKNIEYFQKHYEGVRGAFASSEDASCINWKRMWKILSRLDMVGGGTENEETVVSQEIFAKYIDIDMFWGILHQCMMIRTDFEMNESYKMFIENMFKKMKEKFKNPKYADTIPWGWMWQVLMNSKVYSMVTDKGQKNRGDGYLDKNSYSYNGKFFDELIREDTCKKSYSHFICVLKSDYIGFDMPNASGNDAMKGLKKRFQEIIQELDGEGQIEKIFTHYKEGGKRPIWEVSAVDAKDFYEVIYAMGPLGTLDYFAAKNLYSQLCSDDGWKTGYEGIKKLIECFTEKGDRGNWYKEYKQLDRGAEILCQLVPVVFYGENDNRYIKTYRIWKEDCEKIEEIVREKTLALGIDQVEIKAAELVKKYIDRLSENGYEKRVQSCFKERYLEFLAEQSEKFFQSLDKVYLALKNVEDEKDMAEIAKRAVDSLDVN